MWRESPFFVELSVTNRFCQSTAPCVSPRDFVAAHSGLRATIKKQLEISTSKGRFAALNAAASRQPIHLLGSSANACGRPIPCAADLLKSVAAQVVPFDGERSSVSAQSIRV